MRSDRGTLAAEPATALASNAPAESSASVPVSSTPRPAPAQAEKTEWVSARLTQLNVRPRWRAAALSVEDAALLRDLSEGVSELWIGKLTGNEDVIFIGGRVDGNDWRRLHRSINPTGVVWRIYPHRSTQPADALLTTAATAAGFVRGTRVRYSSDYIADQFTPLRAGR
jgi:hypothetical protein